MKTKRHAKILEIIRDKAVDTQEELIELLREEGFQVTQATVSRDIKELRLIKTLGIDGTYRYAPAKAENVTISGQFYSLFSETVQSVDYAGNIVVVRSLPGMAQAVCASMDSMHWKDVVGTLAGDDTIIVVTRSVEESRALTDSIEEQRR